MASIRLRDLAAALGLDISTVSRALRDDPRVLPATRDLVRSEADRMGYRPNATARALALGRSSTVWFLIPGMQNPVEREPAWHAGLRLLECGYDLLVVQHYNREDVYRRLLDHLATGAADGALVIPCAGSDGVREGELAQVGLPLVFLDRHVEGVSIPVVTTDNHAACAALLDCLRGPGTREPTERIVIINGFETGVTNTVERGRALALGELAREAGIPCLQAAACSRPGLPGHKDLSAATRILAFASSAEPMRVNLATARDINHHAVLEGAIFDTWSGSFPGLKAMAVAIQDFPAMARLSADLLLSRLQPGKPLAETGPLREDGPQKSIPLEALRHELPLARTEQFSFSPLS